MFKLARAFIYSLLSSGFGRKMVFQDDSHAPPGHDMTFKDALNVVSNSAFTKLMVPNWAFGMTPHLRRVRLGFSELEVSPGVLGFLMVALTSPTELYARDDRSAQAHLGERTAMGPVQ